MPFQFQETSRKRPQSGDVFSFHMNDGRYIMGRVIHTKAAISPDGAKHNLIYVYASVLERPHMGISMGVKDLLIHPIITNNQIWLQGFAKTVGNRPVEASEKLAKHAFYNGLSLRDEFGTKITGDADRAFGGGLWDHGAIEERIDDALAKSSHSRKC